jgi:type II secretory pathway pseudopilin PulG
MRITGKRAEWGVTMVEMLVCVAIVAVVGGIAATSYTRSRQAALLQTVLDTIASELGRERTEAATRHEPRTWDVTRLARYGSLDGLAVGSDAGPPGFTAVTRVVFEGGTGRLAATEPAAVAIVVTGGSAAGAVTVTRSGVLEVLLWSGAAWTKR